MHQEPLLEIYGVCDLSVVPVKLEPSDKSEIGTQLLFGELFTILNKSQDGKWVYIEIVQDQYKGWIDSKQYEPVSKEYFTEFQKLQWPVCKDVMGVIQGNGKYFPILMGSTLPFYNNGTVIIGKNILRFDGEAQFINNTPDLKFLERTAKFYLSAPYLWGGKSHFGIDCSGFTQQVMRFCGKQLPRDAYQQAECGFKKPYSERLPGDLAFFHNAHGTVVHVGILLDQNVIIHASGEVRIDVLDENGILNKEKNIYTHKLSSINQIF